MEGVPGTQSPETVTLHSLITCPACGVQRVEVMPEYSCVIGYQCTACGETLRPTQGDCCVFCTLMRRILDAVTGWAFGVAGSVETASALHLPAGTRRLRVGAAELRGASKLVASSP